MHSGVVLGVRSGRCPDPDWRHDKGGDGDVGFEGPTMNGEYSSKQFFYVDAVLTPCEEYGELEGLECATEEEMEEVMGKEIEVGLSWRGKLGWGEEDIWRDIVYLNLEQDKWLGVEVFFTPVNAEKKRLETYYDEEEMGAVLEVLPEDQEQT